MDQIILFRLHFERKLYPFHFDVAVGTNILRVRSRTYLLYYLLYEITSGLVVATLPSDSKVVGWNPVAHQWFFLFKIVMFPILCSLTNGEGKHVDALQTVRRHDVNCTKGAS